MNNKLEKESPVIYHGFWLVFNIKPQWWRRSIVWAHLDFHSNLVRTSLFFHLLKRHHYFCSYWWGIIIFSVKLQIISEKFKGYSQGSNWCYLAFWSSVLTTKPNKHDQKKSVGFTYMYFLTLCDTLPPSAYTGIWEGGRGGGRFVSSKYG